MQLFKYCNENGVLILENLSIKFLDVTKSNDPFDCMPIVNASQTTRFAMRLKLNRERNLGASPNLADAEARRRGFSEKWIKHQRKKAHQAATAGTKFHDFFRMKPNQFFMLSLAKNGSNPLMWSHYSNEHKGILIELNTKNLFKESTGKILWNLELNKVFYDRKRPVLSPLRTDTPEVYLTKDKFWEYEDEWRIFSLPRSLNYDSANDIYTYPITAESIQSVILGCRSDDKTKARVRKALSSAALSHVQLKSSVLDRQTFDFNYIPLL